MLQFLPGVHSHRNKGSKLFILCFLVMAAPDKIVTISEDLESATSKDENRSEAKSAPKARLPGIDLIRISLTWLILLAHTLVGCSFV